MQWSFWLANHNEKGQRSLEDVIGIFGHGLRALGHTAVWDSSNTKFALDPDSVNVVVEGFTPAVAALMADATARGARFVCLATEEPTPSGFNHGREPEMVRRQRDFALAAPYMEGILHLVPGQNVTDWYAQFAPAAYVELGYAPSLVRLQPRVEPTFDFGFFGTVSKRRMTILKRFAKRLTSAKAIRIVSDMPSQDDRDRIMREVRVVLQIRKHEEMGLVSSSRCNTALSIGRPVVAEPHELSKPWDEIVRFSKTMDSFFDEALAVRADWRGVHATQLQALRTKLPPEVCVGEPLRRIGILPS